MAEPILKVRGLTAGYGRAVVINALDFDLDEGKALALLGRNGTGKTTLINTLVGLTTRMRGTIVLGGVDVTALSPESRALAGIGWVPQERGIFRSLTVEENLTAVALPGVWGLAEVYGLFPRLRERRLHLGNNLSGGEQQMLAVARALMLNPKLMLLDEPLEGLAPLVVAELLAALKRVFDKGMSGIIVEQKARLVLPITDHTLVLDRGRVVFQAPSADLIAAPERLEEHLGVKGRMGEGSVGEDTPGRA